jgi:hypothetical protein
MLQECILKLYKSSLKCKAKGAAKIEQERKYVFSNYKTRFFSFSFTLTPPTLSVHNFLIFWVQIEWFKLLSNCHLKLFGKNQPPALGYPNFLAYSSFLPIFSARDVPRRGLHLVLGHHKQWGPPAKMRSKPYLKWLLMGCSTPDSELLLWSDYCEWQVSTMTNKKTNPLMCCILIGPWDEHYCLITTFFFKEDEIIYFSLVKSPFRLWRGLVYAK